jgi:hypothetical protein
VPDRRASIRLRLRSRQNTSLMWGGTSPLGDLSDVLKQKNPAGIRANGRRNRQQRRGLKPRNELTLAMQSCSLEPRCLQTRLP